MPEELWGELDDRAIEAKLIWPPDSPFRRTRLGTEKHRQQQALVDERRANGEFNREARLMAILPEETKIGVKRGTVKVEFIIRAAVFAVYGYFALFGTGRHGVLFAILAVAMVPFTRKARGRLKSLFERGDGLVITDTHISVTSPTRQIIPFNQVYAIRSWEDEIEIVYRDRDSERSYGLKTEYYSDPPDGSLLDVIRAYHKRGQ